MAAFLAAQLPSDASLRLYPDAPGFMTPGTTPSPKSPASCNPSQQARQTFVVLESLRTHKQYSTFRQTVDIAVDSVLSKQLSFRDSTAILSQLVTCLFPDINCLEIVRRLPAWLTAQPPAKDMQLDLSVISVFVSCNNVTLVHDTSRILTCLTFVWCQFLHLQ